MVCPRTLLCLLHAPVQRCPGLILEAVIVPLWEEGQTSCPG